LAYRSAASMSPCSMDSTKRRTLRRSHNTFEAMPAAAPNRNSRQLGYHHFSAIVRRLLSGRLDTLTRVSEPETPNILAQAMQHVATERIRKEIDEQTRKRAAEQHAAPLITRDAVLDLNRRFDVMLEAMQALLTATQALAKSQADEAKESKLRTLLTWGILLGTVAVLIVGVLTLVRT
jgi:hypothetical protein